MRKASSYYHVFREDSDHALQLLHFGQSKAVATCEAENAACGESGNIWHGSLADRELVKAGNNPPAKLPATTPAEIETLLAEVAALEKAIADRDPVRSTISARMATCREERTALFKKGNESIEMADSVSREVAALDVQIELLGSQYETENVWHGQPRQNQVGTLLDAAFSLLQKSAGALIAVAEESHETLAGKVVAVLTKAGRPAPSDFSLRLVTGRGSRFSLPAPFTDGPCHLRRTKLETSDLATIRTMAEAALSAMAREA